MKKFGLILCVVFGVQTLNGQVLDIPSNTLDGVYTQSQDNPNRKAIPYVQLHERDIMWSRRVWRKVDMNEKVNQVFYFPEKPDQGRVSLWFGLFNAILNKGTVTAYSADNDMFNMPLTVNDVNEIRVKECESQVIDPMTGDPQIVSFNDTLLLGDIKKFAIKEEVFFDKQRSVIEYRLLGLAPIGPLKDGGCNIIGEQEMFWVYFPQIRQELVNMEVYNTNNDVHKLTYDDVFWKRMFAAEITKETNVYNRRLDQYLSPMDQLLKSEEIKQQIFNYEHDLWTY